MSLLPAAQEHVLAQEDGKDRCLNAVRELSQAFALAVPHQETTRIRDDVGFFQTVRAALSKQTAREARSHEEMDLAVRQIVSRAVASEGVMDIFRRRGSGQAGHLRALRRVPGRSARDTASESRSGVVAETPEGGGVHEAAEERGAGPIFLRDAGAYPAALPEPVQ